MFIPGIDSCRGVTFNIRWRMLGIRNQGRDCPHSHRCHCNREKLGQQLLDFELPLMVGRLDQLIDVPRCEMWSEEAHRGQMKPAFGKRRGEGRKSPGRTSRLNAPQGGFLGEVQLIHAVRMHGRVAGRDVQPAGIDLCDVG